MSANATLTSPSVPIRAHPTAAHAARSEALRLPNFLVIGAARSGTTTLHYSLGRHPQIFVSSIKETNFFLCDEAGHLPSWVDEQTRRAIPRTLGDYAALFANAAAHHSAVGETSPSYLHGPVAPRIKARLPHVKLIAILRQPTEQALSFYRTWNRGEAPSERPLDRFVAALAGETPPPNGALPLAAHGQFHRHLAPFFEQFDRRQLKVTLLDDLERDSEAYFRDLFAFLGVADDFPIEGIGRYNGSGVARSGVVQRLLSGGARVKGLARTMLPDRAFRGLARLQHSVRSANLRRDAELPADLRRQLTERFYGEDIRALEKLIGRDLGHWLS
jgi:hypothetical protein